MKFLLRSVFVFLFVLGQAWAQDVLVETNPRNPVKGEPFEILFKCQTSKPTDPEISFDAEGFEVLGKQSQGLSTRTIYQNGKIQVFRELLVSYQAVAPKAGRINLRNLVVVLEGKRMTQDTVGINVLDAPVEPRMVFVAADVPKKSVYVGEGITVRYHIYVKAHLQAYDLKKFPELKGFMKRFMQETTDPQGVTVDGERYRRSVIYTSRLYPERAGKLVVDPIEISATYSSDPFASMGFGLGSAAPKTRQFKSEPVEVDVKPLPTAGQPANFSGLVGRHFFDLKATRSQILVNEPMEARLSVSGPGNLESFEAPALWSVPQVERFDAKADLSISSPDAAVKTFDYTYLGKAPGEVPAREIEFSYFDPQAEKYEVIRKKLPEIIVAGNAAEPARPTPKTEDKQAAESKPSEMPQVPAAVASWFSSPILWSCILGLLLVVGVAVQGHRWLAAHRSVRPAWEQDFKLLEKKGPTSALLTRLLHAFAPQSTRPLGQILGESRLPKASQEYFLQLLAQLDRREFATTRPAGDIVLDKKHLQELRKALKGV